ncbi:MAG: putative toxin-antitoxin system toxin component, PIN family [Chloroflexia bacterium]|nr:putative toxin-antitoxin system toxin component, PIN family [Chloroflexia bacterium]
MRIVLDTVILVRGLLDPFGWSGTLLFDRTGAYEWVVCPEIVAEYLDVIRRSNLAEKFRTIAGRDLDAVLDRIGTATLVFPTQIPAVCRDPADDKFLAAAMTGSAQFIVSEDMDLLDLGSYEGIAIVTSSRFLPTLQNPRNT